MRPMSGYHSVQPAMPCPEVGMRYGYDIIVYSAARGVVTLVEHDNGSKFYMYRICYTSLYLIHEHQMTIVHAQTLYLTPDLVEEEQSLQVQAPRSIHSFSPLPPWSAPFPFLAPSRLAKWQILCG